MNIIRSIFLVIILSSTSYSKNKTARFFYSLPEEAGVEWAFLIPECSKFEKDKEVVSCEVYDKHEICKTNRTINLKNTDNKFKQFKLIHHVFKTQADCQSDREQALSVE